MITRLQHLSMPSDFKIHTIEAYANLNLQYNTVKIYETYGNLNPGHEVLGTGRTQRGLPKISDSNLKEYIEESALKGIKFNYTFNARCTSNMEFGLKGQNEILRHVEHLISLGVNQMTVVVPPVLQLIRNHFPDMYLCASVIANIRSVRQASLFKSMGADRLILSEDINRDFKLLEQIRKWCKLPLEIIVNTRCLYQCAFRNSDYNYLSHCGNSAKSLPIYDYYKWLCSQYLFANPIEFYKMRWVRPEDLNHYPYVSFFKVIGRQLVHEADLPRAAEAYMKGSFDGNLLDLLGVFAPSRKRFYPIDIDNNNLKDFINFFLEFKCMEKTCTNCDHCNAYIKRIPNEVLAALNSQREQFASYLGDFANNKPTKTMDVIDIAAITMGSCSPRNYL